MMQYIVIPVVRHLGFRTVHHSRCNNDKWKNTIGKKCEKKVFEINEDEDMGKEVGLWIDNKLVRPTKIKK